MRLLKCGTVPKGEFKKLYREIVKSGVDSLNEVRPLITSVMTKTVGTQYFSLATLKEMGHPYKDHAPGGLHPGVINVQTGEFFQGFRITVPKIIGGTITIYIENDSWKGQVLLHPNHMIARPWESYLMWHLQRTVNPRLTALMANKFRMRRG
jgi:hypothetical protein